MDRLVKADLHVHSRHSNRPSMWALRRFNCPESYTEPLAIYRAARARGMDLVTITDHNSIDGSLAISHLPGTFVSAEVTSYLPEDGCKVHVVVMDFRPQQFAQVLEVRKNVYELVDHLSAHGIPFFLAHPLFDINRRLSADNIEKLLLLFEAVEVRNGARAARYNRFTETMVRSLTPELVERLAEKHHLAPRGARPWEKALVGGSDDHSGLFVATANTTATCDGTVQGFLRALRERRTQPAGEDGDALTLAHSIYSIGYRFFAGAAQGRSDAGGGQRRGTSTPLLNLVTRKMVGREDGDLPLADKARLIARRLLPESARRDPRTFEEVVEREAWRLVRDREFLALLPPDDINRRIFALSSRLVDRLMYEYTKRLFDLRLDRGLAGMVEPLSTVGLLHGLTAPYYIAYHQQTRSRDLMGTLGETFTACAETGSPRIALFTDTLDQVNGVALTIKRLQRVARQRNVELSVITSTDAPTGSCDGVVNFRSVGDVAIPEYPELKLHFPPILSVLDYLDRERFTHVHVSTPGTVGLLGMAAAKLTDLPLAGTYHTDLPQYASRLTGDDELEDLVWSYMVWFHSQLDELLVPSEATMTQLEQRGLPRSFMRPLRRWVDPELFTPELRDPGMWERMGLRRTVRLLYAGRVSREKDLSLLAEVFKRLVDTGLDVSLIVAGNGPYRLEMEHELADYPAVFLGFLQQEELARVYASCDLFVFPSASDTFGNVVLEAQACGLPVVVSDQGGPQELLERDVSGLVVPAHDANGWAAAITGLVADGERRVRMGAAAREFVLSHALASEDAFAATLSPGRTPRRAAGGRERGAVADGDTSTVPPGPVTELAAEPFAASA